MENNKSLFDIAMTVKKSCKEIKLATFFLLALRFWYRMNIMEYGKIQITLQAIVEYALYAEKIYSNRDKHVTIQKETCCWKSPPPDFVKFNVDGAIFYDQHKIKIGITLRDDKG